MTATMVYKCNMCGGLLTDEDGVGVEVDGRFASHHGPTPAIQDAKFHLHHACVEGIVAMHWSMSSLKLGDHITRASKYKTLSEAELGLGERVASEAAPQHTLDGVKITPRPRPMRSEASINKVSGVIANSLEIAHRTKAAEQIARALIAAGYL
jgi:hypothetical protein